MEVNILKRGVTVKSLVAALPGMGNVGGIAAAYLIEELKMEPIAEILDYMPPYVIHKNSLIEFERFSFKLYWGGKDFAVFTGFYQPQDPHMLYELCDDLLDLAVNLGVKRIYTLGAAHTGVSVSEPRVFYAVTDARLNKEIESYGAQQMRGEGYITGFNGLLLGLAAQRNIEGVCFLGEIERPDVAQPKASIEVLKRLSAALGIEYLDYTKLEEQARKVEFYISSLKRAEEFKQQKTRTDIPPGVM
ncbi:MAG: PAC2 family protein [Thaumarchaeota archaeon]|nr:PAC2 family protein [Candidatus Terraquivivens yellowstonensis]